MRVLALGYHDVVPRPARATSGFQGAGPDRYKVAPEAFAEHLAALESVGRSPGRVAGGADLVLTFDDGGAAAVDHAAPTLGPHPGHFFVVTDRIGSPGFLSADGIRELSSAGHVIGSHSASHAILSRLAAGEVLDEWRRSRTVLEEILGAAVTTAAVPRGYAPARVLTVAAAAGYEHVFTSEPWLTPRRAGAATTYGRFAITESTSASHVAALARGDRLTIARAASGWYARKAAKRAAGPLYEKARNAVLSRARA